MSRFNEARVSAAILGSRAARTYTFPGTSIDDAIEVAVRVIPDGEIDSCRVAAQVHVLKLAKTRGWKPDAMVNLDPALLDRELERQIVFRAFIDSETIGQPVPTRFFESVDEVRKLDSVLLTTLVSLYIEHQEWTSGITDVDGEEVERLVEALGKGLTPQVFLGRYAPNTLRSFVIFLAARLRGETSLTSKSSSGGSADSGESSEPASVAAEKSPREG